MKVKETRKLRFYDYDFSGKAKVGNFWPKEPKKS
jgi:hypothetical protein